MNVKSNYYKPLEVDTFRRNYAEKSGYSLKRNQSPVAVKPILHVAISSGDCLKLLQRKTFLIFLNYSSQLKQHLARTMSLERSDTI